MITYRTTVERPRLKIVQDTGAESPRNWSTLGYFITVEHSYGSPDGDPEGLRETINMAQIGVRNVQEHMEKIKQLRGEDIVYIAPITRYEHGNVQYLLGAYSGWDYSVCGFYIVTKKQRDDFDDTWRSREVREEEYRKVIEGELNSYNAWVNGEVYCFQLFDDKGNIEDSLYGLYSVEEIRDYLPEEFKDEILEDYIVY